MAATDINPDILLLDEIFSVGDEVFRKKATARMETSFRKRKTVVLVSHSMPLIERYATRVLYLRGGKVEAFGDPKEVIEQYLADVDKKSQARK